MNEDILSKIKIQNERIEKQINDPESLGYGSTCADVINKVRTLIETIAVYYYGYSNNSVVRLDYDTIKNKAIPFINKEKELNFLSKLHYYTQAAASHYVIEEETASRLYLKYLPFLIDIRKWFYNKFKVKILNNISKLYMEKDDELAEYYSKIYDLFVTNMPYQKNSKRYYVYRCIPIYVNNDLIYELTLVPASDFASKFNRFVAFCNFKIKTNYSIQINYVEKIIKVRDMEIPIRIITNYSVSIRPCEFNNFAKLLGMKTNVSSNLNEYKNLMNYLTTEHDSLVDIIKKDRKLFKSFKTIIMENAETENLISILEEAREAVSEERFGYNVILYLLYRMNNRVIKDQYSFDANYHDLYIHKDTSPFNSNPFAMNLKKHQTHLSDLLEIFDISDCEEQLLYRYIQSKTEIDGKLYIGLGELHYTEDEIKQSIKKINDSLNWKKTSQIKVMNDKLYILNYEFTTKSIIDKLLELSKSGMQDYKDYVTNTINSRNLIIDSDEKGKVLGNLFSSSHVAMIYGPAGTGKSFLAKHISAIFSTSKRIYLAATHPAVNNLYRKIGGTYDRFMTISSYLTRDITADILFIDECSTVSNSDMLKILESSKFKYLVLLGDICQIQSIKYGPWFKYAKVLLPMNTKFELLELHRTSSKNLEELWNLVRNRDDRIEEFLSQYNLEKEITDSSILEIEDNQIVLCLNYDGLYGINNINRLLQSKNYNKEFVINDYSYKTGDPILFTENNQYSKILYNNLKGTIVHIDDNNNYVNFILNVERVFNEFDLSDYPNLKLLKTNSDGTSDIVITVDREIDSDYDEQICKLVPFQVAYAISIHKSQGLEYENVKVIISNTIFDRISHDIFYTAITRATKKLTIYWGEQTEAKILKNIRKNPDNEDIKIFATKFKYKIRDKNFDN